MFIVFIDWYAYQTLVYMFIQGENPEEVSKYSFNFDIQKICSRSYCNIFLTYMFLQNIVDNM